MLRKQNCFATRDVVKTSEWAAPLIGVAAAAPAPESISAVFLFITEVIADVGSAILQQGSKNKSAKQLTPKCRALVNQMKDEGAGWADSFWWPENPLKD